MTQSDPYPNETYDVECRIVGHSNSAVNYYFTVNVEMFAYEEGECGTLLLLTEESKRELRDSYVSILDGLYVDMNVPEEHSRIESFSVRKT